jgi:hypothetical protein
MLSAAAEHTQFALTAHACPSQFLEYAYLHEARQSLHECYVA